MQRRCAGAVLLVIAMTVLPGPGLADGLDNLQGWGQHDAYNLHYRNENLEKIRAWVVGFRAEPPLPGMAPATILMVNDGTRIIDVHLCPSWFARPEDTGIRSGERVKVIGCRAIIGGQEIIMAAKVKKGDFFEFKVRLTRNGKPFWTFTPEELVSEIERQGLQPLSRP